MVELPTQNITERNWLQTTRQKESKAQQAREARGKTQLLCYGVKKQIRTFRFK